MHYNAWCGKNLNKILCIKVSFYDSLSGQPIVGHRSCEYVIHVFAYNVIIIPFRVTLVVKRQSA